MLSNQKIGVNFTPITMTGFPPCHYEADLADRLLPSQLWHINRNNKLKIPDAKINCNWLKERWFCANSNLMETASWHCALKRSLGESGPKVGCKELNKQLNTLNPRLVFTGASKSTGVCGLGRGGGGASPVPDRRKDCFNLKPIKILSSFSFLKPSVRYRTMACLPNFFILLNPPPPPPPFKRGAAVITLRCFRQSSPAGHH